MSELVERVRRVAGQAHPAWTAERAVANELLVERRRTRRRSIRRIGALATLVLCVAGAWLASRLPRSGHDEIRYADGSRALPLVPDASLVIELASATETSTRLDRGGFRFQVTKQPGRTFRVIAGEVRVEVIGTEFAVERIDAEHARVKVWDGRVRVRWGDQDEEMSVGEERSFPPRAASTAIEEVAPTAETTAPRATAPVLRTTPSWVRLAQAGDYDGAYLAKQRSHDEARSAMELMLASDAARLSHHPSDAVAPLRDLLARHSRDPRAPLAAFTLGRVLLDDLGLPRDAAAAFARARSLAPGGALEGDALAREVEAWSRAGEPIRAHELAREYLAAFPTGVRARSVRRFGGID